MAAPLLDLQTLTEVPTVAIDGVPYELTPTAALDVVRSFRLDAVRTKYADLWPRMAEGSQSEDDAVQFEQAVDAIVRLVLVAPAEVIDKLTVIQKMGVAQVFFTLSPVQQATPTTAPRRPMRPTRSTGVNSSRALSGSMAAVRSTGSRKSRSRSLKRAL